MEINGAYPNKRKIECYVPFFVYAMKNNSYQQITVCPPLTSKVDCKGIAWDCSLEI